MAENGSLVGEVKEDMIVLRCSSNGKWSIDAGNGELFDALITGRLFLVTDKRYPTTEETRDEVVSRARRRIGKVRAPVSSLTSEEFVRHLGMDLMQQDDYPFVYNPNEPIKSFKFICCCPICILSRIRWMT